MSGLPRSQSATRPEPRPTLARERCKLLARSPRGSDASASASRRTSDACPYRSRRSRWTVLALSRVRAGVTRGGTHASGGWGYPSGGCGIGLDHAQTSNALMHRLYGLYASLARVRIRSYLAEAIRRGRFRCRIASRSIRAENAETISQRPATTTGRYRAEPFRSGRQRSGLAGPVSARACRNPACTHGTRLAERHRSRTCLASGYDAVLVLKTSWGTGPRRSAADTN